MQQENIIIVDYGVGNLGSIRNMLKHIGITAIITNDQKAIKSADKLILSGVGSFDSGMKNINDLGLLPVLREKVLNQKTPILGICLGMQLFSRKSEEGQQPGLGWIAADTVRFKFEDGQPELKIPHMGWNLVNPQAASKLFKDMLDEARFYFVHSYHVVCDHAADIACTTLHGYPFVSAIEKENIFGVQFHPEKSHKFGMKLLKNFIDLTYA